MTNEIEIVPFEEHLSGAFKDLNTAWLQKYFYVEPIDEEMLSNPGQYIIQKQGHIFFAKSGTAIAGTFALMRMEEGVFELGKMAVSEHFQGQKIGNQMLAFALQKAKALGASKVVLYSNTLLQPAIHLYHKYGFQEVPLGNSDYKRSNIKMEKVLA